MNTVDSILTGDSFDPDGSSIIQCLLLKRNSRVADGI